MKRIVLRVQKSLTANGEVAQICWKVEKMKSIVLRVRKRYIDVIDMLKKNIEYRRDSEFWRKRLNKYVGIENPGLIAVFLCGKQVVRRLIKIIRRIRTPSTFSEQGKKDVDTPMCFAIHLGDKIQ